MRDTLLDESLFFGLGYARSAIAEWITDYNNRATQLFAGFRNAYDHHRKQLDERSAAGQPTSQPHRPANAQTKTPPWRKARAAFE